MFDLKEYTQSNIWSGNQLLVQLDGSKRCENCGKFLYSIEFPDCDFFADGKFPVCSTCGRKQDKTEFISVVDAHNKAQECTKCKETQSVSQFIARSGEWTKIDNRCASCRSMPKHLIP